MIHGVHEPDPVVFRENVDDGRVYVEGHLVLEDISDLPFLVLKNNFRPLVRHLDAAAVGSQRILSFAAVEHHHIAGPHHVHENGFHVRHIKLEGAGVHTGDLLLHSPAFRFLEFVEIAHQPHSVIFYDNALRLMKDIHRHQTVCGEILLFLNDLHHGITHRKHIPAVLYFSLFAENEKRLSFYIEIILLQGKIQKRGLAAFQKTCEQINGNCDLVHISS